MNIKSYPKLFAAFALIIFFTSCFPGYQVPYYIPEPRQKENVYYVPSTSNTPLLTRKNDLALSLNFAAASNHESVDLQGSYAFARHFGVTGNMSSPSKKYKNVRLARSELAVGYFLPLKNNWHFETYAGGGSGNMENKHETGFSTIKINQFFIQPAIAIHNQNNNVQFGFVSRITKTKFKLVDTSFSNDRERFSADQILTVTKNPDNIFWEPGLTLRVGWKELLFNLNYTILADLTKADFAKAKNNFSLGVRFRSNVGKKQATKL